MEKTDSEHFPLRLSYDFLRLNGLGQQATNVRESKAKFMSYDSTLKRAMVLTELAQNRLLDRFIAEVWPPGGTAKGQREIQRLNKLYDRYLKSIGDSTVEAAMEIDDTAQGTAFAYEEHLRDYLAQHLERLEKGLELLRSGDEDPVEFSVGSGRRVDILAKDSAGLPVVIELKVSRGHEKTIGQALFYRARIKEMFKVERVRIFIVALELSAELQAAAKELTDVSLFEYSLSMTIKSI